MAEEQAKHVTDVKQHQGTDVKGEDQGPEDDTVGYWMSTSGDEDTTVWDNLVQAFKPNLMPKREKKEKA